MAIVTTDSEHYAAIAEAIRTKTGGAEAYMPSQMAAAIAGIGTSGALPAQGTFTLSANYATAGATYTVTHGLGRVPSVFILLCTEKTSTSNSCIMLMWRAELATTMCYRNTEIAEGGTVNTTYNSVAVTETEAVITVGTANGSLRSGDTYQWLCW